MSEILKTIYLFDVDETLEVSGGPVKINQLINLRKQGHIIGLCGNFAVFVQRVGGWNHLISLMKISREPKRIFLSEVRQFIPAARYVMVGNVNPTGGNYSDREEAVVAGFEFIEEKDFKEGL